MGCSSDKCGLTKTLTRNKNNQEENDLNISEPNLKLNENVTNEDQILIYSEMLVNENKEDVLKYYVPMETIGQGSYGKVFKVRHRTTGKTYAMKLIEKNSTNNNNTNNNNNKSSKNFLNEIYILRKLDHPNILKVYEYFSNEKYWYFVMEYLSGGELYDRIVDMQYYDESTAAHIMKQIFSCVSYLHQMNIVHRDLKPENMMVTTKKDLTIKLIDFGTATFFKPKEKLTMKVGSPYYIAPEVLKGSYNKECDLWSCGIILYGL